MVSTDFSLKYFDKILSPEAVLSAWMNISLISLTVALVFYHICRKGSIRVDGRIAAIVTILLVVISILYLLVPLHNYNPRIDRVVTACKNDKGCTKQQQADIELSKTTNVFLGNALILIEVVIAYLVINTI